MRHKGPGMLAAAALLATGCYKATFVADRGAAKLPPTHEVWTEHYAFGLVGHATYDARDYCPQGVSAVRTGGNAATSLVTLATLGIYAPRKVYFTCAPTLAVAP